jgi:hypothetical protein
MNNLNYDRFLSFMAVAAMLIKFKETIYQIYQIAKAKFWLLIKTAWRNYGIFHVIHENLFKKK